MSAWLPLFVTIVSLIGGMIVYQFQKTADRRNQVKQERRELYRRYVIAYTTCWQSILKDEKTSLDKIKQLDQLLAEIAVTAPEAVVEASVGTTTELAILGMARKAEDWLSEASEYSRGMRTVHSQYLNLVAAMRKDTFEDTAFDGKKLSEVLQLGGRFVKK